jgi:hypothetical protein
VIKGKYVFKSNGEIIAEKENILTANGIDMINRFLSQGVQDWAGTVVVGSLYTTTASTDTKLAYEVSRSPVTLKLYSPSGTYINGAVSGSNQIILKASLDPLLSASIYEIGIIPQNYFQASIKDNFYISDFSEVYGTSGSSSWQIGSSSLNMNLSASSRVGSYNVGVTTSGTIFKSGFGIDLSNFNTSDYLQMLYYLPNATSSALVNFIFTDSSGNTWTTPTITLNPSASGYYSASTILTNSPATSFNYYVDTVTASFANVSGSVYLDSLKLMGGDTKTPEEQLVSRTSSSAALVITKYGQPTEIEYYLTVT